ncbi:calmodulin-lysine N-methyltransferase [Anoplophora glabripennis]|uniref:calmodulin-lysine N-methyltransferase n=1 Tax=Anoplophora glabripennis TaxID=217634 RepID=UPI0008742A9F|nr:calmodulin-lysine N-methyltransferase [Anoplophora glabripennis]
MDQNKDIFGFNSKCSITLNEVIQFGNEKKKVARRRWAILAKALKSPTESQPSSPTDEFSVRRISSFMLLKTQELSTIPIIPAESQCIDQIKKRTWFKYSITVDEYDYFINVGHRNRTFSAEDLMGFNNTGNICIWPSEETLSYYVCSNLEKFNHKSVLELGGGMSCLAGLFAAKYGKPKRVTVTDGNKVSVDNVQVTLKCNEFETSVKCKVLKWNCYDAAEKFDVILCADCLFFDDARADLIECLWACLANDGIAYVMAPQRGNTLDNFLSQSEGKGFICKKIPNYNNIVWEKRLALLNHCDYNDNIHYPILIEVTKE